MRSRREEISPEPLMGHSHALRYLSATSCVIAIFQPIVLPDWAGHRSPRRFCAAGHLAPACDSVRCLIPRIEAALLWFRWSRAKIFRNLPDRIDSASRPCRPRTHRRQRIAYRFIDALVRRQDRQALDQDAAASFGCCRATHTRRAPSAPSQLAWHRDCNARYTECRKSAPAAERRPSRLRRGGSGRRITLSWNYRSWRNFPSSTIFCRSRLRPPPPAHPPPSNAKLRQAESPAPAEIAAASTGRKFNSISPISSRNTVPHAPLQTIRCGSCRPQ